MPLTPYAIDNLNHSYRIPMIKHAIDDANDTCKRQCMPLLVFLLHHMPLPPLTTETDQVLRPGNVCQFGNVHWAKYSCGYRCGFQKA